MFRPSRKPFGSGFPRFDYVVFVVFTFGVPRVERVILRQSPVLRKSQLKTLDLTSQSRLRKGTLSYTDTKEDFLQWSETRWLSRGRGVGGTRKGGQSTHST